MDIKWFITPKNNYNSNITDHHSRYNNNDHQYVLQKNEAYAVGKRELLTRHAECRDTTNPQPEKKNGNIYKTQ